MTNAVNMKLKALCEQLGTVLGRPRTRARTGTAFQRRSVQLAIASVSLFYCHTVFGETTATATRSFDPLCYTAGQDVTVTITTSYFTDAPPNDGVPAIPNVTSAGIFDIFPEGWTFVSADNGGVLNLVDHRVSWISFEGALSAVSYVVTPAPDGFVNFTGGSGGFGDGAVFDANLGDSILCECGPVIRVAVNPPLTSELTTPQIDLTVRPREGEISASDDFSATFTGLGYEDTPPRNYALGNIEVFSFRIIQANGNGTANDPWTAPGAATALNSPTFDNGNDGFLDVNDFPIDSSVSPIINGEHTFNGSLTTEEVSPECVQDSLTFTLNWEIPPEYVTTDTVFVVQFRAQHTSPPIETIAEWAMNVRNNQTPVLNPIAITGGEDTLTSFDLGGVFVQAEDPDNPDDDLNFNWEWTVGSGVVSSGTEPGTSSGGDTGPWTANIPGLTNDNFVKNDNVELTVTAENMVNGQVSNTESDSKVVGNAQPTIEGSVTINPQAPVFDTAALVVDSSEIEVSDPDSVDVTSLLFQWFESTTGGDFSPISGATTDTLTLADLPGPPTKWTRGNEYKVEVRATDGEDTSSGFLADTVLIHNTPATAENNSLFIEKDDPAVTDPTGMVTVIGSDPDDDGLAFELVGPNGGAANAANVTIDPSTGKITYVVDDELTEFFDGNMGPGGGPDIVTYHITDTGGGTSNDATVEVTYREGLPPEVTNVNPAKDNTDAVDVTIDEVTDDPSPVANSQTFEITVTDVNDPANSSGQHDIVSVEWFCDDNLTPVQIDNSFPSGTSVTVSYTFTTAGFDEVLHPNRDKEKTVRVLVTDLQSQTMECTWNLIIEDVDRPPSPPTIQIVQCSSGQVPTSGFFTDDNLCVIVTPGAPDPDGAIDIDSTSYAFNWQEGICDSTINCNSQNIVPANNIITPEQLTHSLNGSPTATGFGVYLLDPSQDILTYCIFYDDDQLTSLETGTHIHGFAGCGQSATALHTISDDINGVGSPKFGVWAYGSDPQDEAEILAGLTYVNIHTADNGPGEIRGQIYPFNTEDDELPSTVTVKNTFYNVTVLCYNSPYLDDVKGISSPECDAAQIQNTSPEAESDSLTTCEDQCNPSGPRGTSSEVIELSGFDEDGDNICFIIDSLPSNGTLFEGISTNPSDAITSVPFGLACNGTIETYVTYCGDDDVGGDSDEFTFTTIDDNSDKSDPATIGIIIEEANDLPVPVDLHLPVQVNTPTTDPKNTAAVPLDANDVDHDDNALTFQLLSLPSTVPRGQPASGTLKTQGGNGVGVGHRIDRADLPLVFTPADDFEGELFFEYISRDDNGPVRGDNSCPQPDAFNDAESAIVTILVTAGPPWFPVLEFDCQTSNSSIFKVTITDMSSGDQIMQGQVVEEDCNGKVTFRPEDYMTASGVGRDGLEYGNYNWTYQEFDQDSEDFGNPVTGGVISLNAADYPVPVAPTNPTTSVVGSETSSDASHNWEFSFDAEFLQGFIVEIRDADTNEIIQTHVILFQRDGETGDFPIHTEVDLDNPSFEVFIPEDGNYEWRARGFNPQGTVGNPDVPYTPWQNFTIEADSAPVDPPEAPTPLSPYNDSFFNSNMDGTATIKFDWGVVKAAKGYYVYVATLDGRTLVNRRLVTAPPLAGIEVPPGDWRWGVAAFNDEGVSSWARDSDTNRAPKFTVFPNAVLGDPGSLEIFTNAVGGFANPIGINFGFEWMGNMADSVTLSIINAETWQEWVFEGLDAAATEVDPATFDSGSPIAEPGGVFIVFGYGINADGKRGPSSPFTFYEVPHENKP